MDVIRPVVTRIKSKPCTVAMDTAWSWSESVYSTHLHHLRQGPVTVMSGGVVMPLRTTAIHRRAKPQFFKLTENRLFLVSGSPGAN